MTPIRELDRIGLGAGSRGPITEKTLSAFFDIVNGRNPKMPSWRDPPKRFIDIAPNRRGPLPLLRHGLQAEGG